ncbi:MAG TPA: hypothetical protein VGS22_18765 [Thermoanaerobaculia bacterium]|jgi:hypothetical protein|nr:hypothetical protein [Thermoanaerobaculia bacterium]
MAGNGQTLGARISRWNTLVTNLEPDLPDMQHLAGDVAQLKEILLRSREFEAHQDDLRFQAQGTTAARKDLAAQGDRLRRRIGASLQWKHGFGSETLLKFGFRPRRQPLRTKKRETPAVTNVSPEAA